MWSDPSKQRGDYQGWVCWQRVTRGGPTHQFSSHYRCHLRRPGVFFLGLCIFKERVSKWWSWFSLCHWKWGGTSDENTTQTVGKKCNELIDCAMWQGVQAPLHLQYQQQAQLLWLKKWGCRCGQFFAVAKPASRMNISCNTEVVHTKNTVEPPKRFKAWRFCFFFLLWWRASEWLHQKYQTWFPLGGSLIISTPLLATGFFGHEI